MTQPQTGVQQGGPVIQRFGALIAVENIEPGRRLRSHLPLSGEIAGPIC